MARAQGFEQNPPSALDGGVMRERVWPAFAARVPYAERPKDWSEDSFDAYSRYMTAIQIWARMKGWTTKQVEASIFDEYKD